jgi:hypothetical protein
MVAHPPPRVEALAKLVTLALHIFTFLQLFINNVPTLGIGSNIAFFPNASL